MTSEVTELIVALRDGTMTLEQVAQQFRERSWPKTRAPQPTTFLDLAVAAERDPNPDIPGSFDEVTAAYDRGQLSRQQYRVLAEAAAESLRAEDEGGG